MAIIRTGPGGITVDINVDSSDVSGYLQTLRSNARVDWRRAYRRIARVLTNAFAENFRQGGRPRWAPLSANTLAAKEATGEAEGLAYATAAGRQRVRRLAQMKNGKMTRSLSNILIASGELRDSYMPGRPHHIERYSAEGVTVGSDHPLAAIHEYGTGGRTIVARNAKRLRFNTAKGLRSAKSVNHPGIPARPVLTLQPEDQKEIDAIVAEFLEGAP
jgi:phage gpG-like protein